MLRVGTVGWVIDRAVARHFPRDGNDLKRYARRLNCVEIESTFYRHPRPITWNRWAATVRKGFRFAVRIPRSFTYQAQLLGDPASLRDFIDGASLLGEKLGPLVFQLGPRLPFDPHDAGAFLAQLRETYTGLVAFEPLHPTWYSPEASELMRSFQIARVIVDPAKVPEAANPGGWEGLAYYHLRGTPRTHYSVYTEEFLESLATSIADRHPEGESWVIFDHVAPAASARNAISLNDISNPPKI
jgi:uncharacterized protein YecE (DUF72 family)